MVAWVKQFTLSDIRGHRFYRSDMPFLKPNRGEARCSLRIHPVKSNILDWPMWLPQCESTFSYFTALNGLDLHVECCSWEEWWFLYPVPSTSRMYGKPLMFDPRCVNSVRLGSFSAPPETRRATELDHGAPYMWNSVKVLDARLRAELGGAWRFCLWYI